MFVVPFVAVGTEFGVTLLLADSGSVEDFRFGC